MYSGFHPVCRWFFFHCWLQVGSLRGPPWSIGSYSIAVSAKEAEEFRKTSYLKPCDRLDQNRCTHPQFTHQVPQPMLCEILGRRLSRPSGRPHWQCVPSSSPAPASSSCRTWPGDSWWRRGGCRPTPRRSRSCSFGDSRSGAPRSGTGFSSPGGRPRSTRSPSQAGSCPGTLAS